MKLNTPGSPIERALREGAERERQRIGQELHDHLCQQLRGAAFAAKAAAAACEPGSPVREEIEEVAQLVNGCVQQVRKIVRGFSAAG